MPSPIASHHSRHALSWRTMQNAKRNQKNASRAMLLVSFALYSALFAQALNLVY